MPKIGVDVKIRLLYEGAFYLTILGNFFLGLGDGAKAAATDYGIQLQTQGR